MGHPDGAHTHGSGGSGLGTAVLVVIGAALAVKLAGPGPGRRRRTALRFANRRGGNCGRWCCQPGGPDRLAVALAEDAVRAMPPRTLVARAAPPLPQARRAAGLPAAPQRETPGGLHLHFHGLDAAQVAAIIAREQEGDVNPGG